MVEWGNFSWSSLKHYAEKRSNPFDPPSPYPLNAFFYDYKNQLSNIFVTLTKKLHYVTYSVHCVTLLLH